MKHGITMSLAWVLLGVALLPAPKGNAQTQPTTMSVSSIAGYIDYTNASTSRTVLVPATADTGTVGINATSPAADTLSITPLESGQFTYKASAVTSQSFTPLQFQGVLPGSDPPQFINPALSNALYGWWEELLAGSAIPGYNRYVIGYFAAGSELNYSEPDGNATYCGFYTLSTKLGTRPFGEISGDVEIQVQVVPNAILPATRRISLLKMNTQYPTNVLAANAKIENVGSNGIVSALDLYTQTLSNGKGGAILNTTTTGGKAVVQFYGPEWLQVVGTFDGDWHPYGLPAGTFVGSFGANKSPTNQLCF